MKFALSLAFFNIFFQGFRMFYPKVTAIVQNLVLNVYHWKLSETGVCVRFNKFFNETKMKQMEPRQNGGVEC